MGNNCITNLAIRRLANLNTTMNGTKPSSCFNPTAEKIGGTFVYCLLFLVSLAGNSFIGIIVYKTKTMRKPINILIVNMAMHVRSFVSNFSVSADSNKVTRRLPVADRAVVLLARPYVSCLPSSNMFPLPCLFRAWF